VPQNRQKLASVNEALASCSRGKQSNWSALLLDCYRFYSLKGKGNCMELFAMTKG